MQYLPVYGSRLTPEQAQRYGEAIERWDLTRPVDVVEAARPVDSPLHDAFEWEDSRAAELYRRQQAAYVLRSIDVVVEDRPVRAFVVVQVTPDAPTREYLSINVVRRNGEFMAQVVAAARRDLRAWQRKYAEYVKLADDLKRVTAVIDAELAEVAE